MKEDEIAARLDAARATMQNKVELFTVGYASDGRIAVHVHDAKTRSVQLLTLEGAEWLRDRLFHICATERAKRGEPITPVAPAIMDDEICGCGTLRKNHSIAEIGPSCTHRLKS